jgi:glycine/D-amino acid oxidase-like deaminating enzyme
VAAGPGVTQLWDGVENMNLKLVRGQNLLVRDKSADALRSKTVALLAGEYVVPRPSDGVFICGATHEYSDVLAELEADANMQVCSSLLTDKIDLLRKGLMDKNSHTAEVVGCTVGIRVVTPRSHHGKIPFVRQHKNHKNIWTLGGLGSRGLIWHALLGKMVVKAASTGATTLPPELLQDFSSGEKDKEGE